MVGVSKKTKRCSVICVAAGMALYILMEVTDQGAGGVTDGYYLIRSSPGQGETNFTVMVDGLVSEELTMDIPVSEKQYSSEEAEQVFQQIELELERTIPGENLSIKEVRTDLNLRTQLDEWGVAVRWESEDSEIVDSFGKVYGVRAGEENTSVRLKALLSDGVNKKEIAFDLIVLPEQLTEKEEAEAGFMSQVQKLDKEQNTEDRLELPKEYNGKQLYYRTEKSADHAILLVLGVLLAFLFYAKDKMDLQNVQKRREQQLMLDYSEVVSKLMVFLCAGMTVRTAWERIAGDYEQAVRAGRKKKRFAYEEMSAAVYEMKSGTPEGQAYASFGRRCGLQPYLKLCSLLEQNRKAGTKNLKAILEVEMTAAFEQRKNLAKRLGEEAGTKLLLPLFLLLGIVMVMIVVPAFLSFA